jgi:pimeloyl-ACP methyl ester carboxylesterase
VFLHGNPDTHDVWSDVVARMQARHRCIAPDLPGYGASSEQHDVSLDAHAAVVRELFDALGLARADLVVHDVGGTYGLAFATVHPERVRTLSIFNTMFFRDYRWHFWARVWRTPIVGDLTMLLGNEALVLREMKKHAPKLPVDVVRRSYAQYGRKTRRMVLRWYRYMDPERFIGWDERMVAALKGVRHQVLWGERDPFLPASMAGRFGDGPVHRFPDLSHWVMAEDPARAAEVLAGFIDA